MIESLHTCNGRRPIGELRPVRRRRGHRLQPRRRSPLAGGRRRGEPGARSSVASAREASGHRPRPPARRDLVAAPDAVAGAGVARPRGSPREHGGKVTRTPVVWAAAFGGQRRTLYIHPVTTHTHTAVWCTNVRANVSGRVYERGRERCAIYRAVERRCQLLRRYTTLSDLHCC